MKRILTLSVAVLLLTALFPFLPSKSDLSLYDNVIRLHILANSDSEADQALKLFVRDSVISYVGSLVTEAKSKAEAESAIRSSLDGIRKEAELAIQKYGANDEVSVSLSTEEYPRKTYGFVTLPSGSYTSLRIMIGNAEGANWWCVLFPKLCTSLALGEPIDAKSSEKEFIEVGFTPSQYKIITESNDKKITIKFRIIEIFEELFKK